MKTNEVKPFRGLRYNREIVPDLSAVITPPYDVITPDAQRHYLDKSPFSSIRLDFAPVTDDDDDRNNRYTRSAAVLEDWLREKVLVPEKKPALYWCREEYQAPDGSPAVREGLFATLGLVGFSEGLVLPHEETSPGPKSDRLALMTATQANLSPIFCLYSDPQHEVNKLLEAELGREPAAVAIDEAGTRHSLWVIDDPETVAAVGGFFPERKLLIADGHHRYETALAYRDQRRREDDSQGPQPYDYMMVYLSNTDNPGMAIFPLHRLVSGLSAETLANLLPSLEQFFDVEKLGPDSGMKDVLSLMRERGASRNVFGLHLAADGGYYLLSARRERPMIRKDEDSHSAAYRSLDVAVLDRVILGGILGIAPGGTNEDASIRFVERAEMSPEEIARADHQIMLLVNPTTMDEIKAVSEAGEKMPKKSTYFYPKPATGLVFRSLKY